MHFCLANAYDMYCCLANAYDMHFCLANAYHKIGRQNGCQHNF
jgi:hypothetical protein